MPASTSLTDIVYLLLRKGLEVEGERGGGEEGGGGVARENLLSLMKVIY